MALQQHHKRAGAYRQSPIANRSRLPCVRARALLSLFQPKQQQQQKSQQQLLSRVVPPECARAQAQILEALTGAVGRGRDGLSVEQLDALDAAVTTLEGSGKGVPDAASSPLLDGTWRLVFTSRPGSASPIQRTFVGVDAFSVQQWVSGLGASGDEDGEEDGAEEDDDDDKQQQRRQQRQGPRVDNVVRFGRGADAWGYLRVEAEASTERRPLAGFTPRSGAGLPLFGQSFNTRPAAGPGARVDFAFDRAAFYLFGGKVQVPYPVPFRLLGDERKGWLDVTYLSRDGAFRLSRGNKGTLFVLRREEEGEEGDGPSGAGGGGGGKGEAEQGAGAIGGGDGGPGAFFARLFSPQAGGASTSSRAAAAPPAVADVLAAARASAAAPSDAAKAAEALALVDRLVAAAPSAAGRRGTGVVRRPARNAEAVSGVWRLVWTRQSASASALQRWGASQAKSYQVIDAVEGGLAMNVVDLRPFAEVRAFARCELGQSDERTGVRIEGGEVVFAPGPAGGGGGGLRVPLPVKGSADGYVDWLYLDRDVRVTRGSKGSLFLHVREGSAADAAAAIPDF